MLVLLDLLDYACPDGITVKRSRMQVGRSWEERAAAPRPEVSVRNVEMRVLNTLQL